MFSTPRRLPPQLSTHFVITRRGAILFDHAAISSGPVMNWRGREQHGNFAVESATPVPILRGEQLVISGSDGTRRSIIVTESVDNVVYFRADNDVDSSRPSTAFDEQRANTQDARVPGTLLLA
jgi:hypothetical protein